MADAATTAENTASTTAEYLIANYTITDSNNATATTATLTTAVPGAMPRNFDLGHVVGAFFGGFAVCLVITFVVVVVLRKVCHYRFRRHRQRDTPELDVLLTRHRDREKGGREEGGGEGTPQERRYEANPDTMPRHQAPPPPSDGRRSKVPDEPSSSLYLHPVHRESEYLEPVSPKFTTPSNTNATGVKSPGAAKPPATLPKPRGITPKASSGYQNVDTGLPGSPHAEGDDKKDDDKDLDEDADDGNYYEPVAAPFSATVGTSKC